MQPKSKFPTPTAAKLQAWEKVRAAWIASGKVNYRYVSEAVLDAEYEASLVD